MAVKKGGETTGARGGGPASGCRDGDVRSCRASEVKTRSGRPASWPGGNDVPAGQLCPAGDSCSLLLVGKQPR